MKGIRALTLSSTKVEIDSAINLLKTLKLSFLLGAYSTFLGTEGTLVSLTSAAFFYFASFIAAAFLSLSSSLACLCFSFSSCIAIFFSLCSSCSWAFFYALSLAFFCSSSSLFCFCSFLTCSLSSFLGFSGLSWSWGLFNFFFGNFFSCFSLHFMDIFIDWSFFLSLFYLTFNLEVGLISQNSQGVLVNNYLEDSNSWELVSPNFELIFESI